MTTQTASLDAPAQALWRTVSPGQLLESRQIRGEVAQRIAQVIARLPETIPDCGPEVGAVVQGDMRPLVAAATCMPAQPGVWQQARFDLRQTLALWGVVHHTLPGNWRSGREHPLARLLLVAGLAAWAKDLPPPSKATLQMPRHRRSQAQRAEVAAWRKERRTVERLALDWLRQGIGNDWLLDLDGQLGRHTIPAAPAQTVATAPESVVGPAKVVMERPFEVGLSTSKDRREEAERWNHLAAPLPLAAGADRSMIVQALTTEFPWMAAAIERIAAELVLREMGNGEPWFHFRPLLLVGPPACGKSRFARRLGEVVGVKTRIMSVAGSSDARELVGTAKGWSTASPCAPIRLIAEARQANPLMVIDELDKVGTSTHNGRVTDALLTMIEPETAGSWYDEGLGRSVDLTAVNWLFLANSLGSIPGPLRSRLGIIRVDRPAPAHFNVIIQSMLGDIAGEIGIAVERLPSLHPEALAYLGQRYRRGATLRQVRSAIEKALVVVETERRT